MRPYSYSEVIDLKPTSKLAQSCLKNSAHLLQIWFLRMVSVPVPYRRSAAFTPLQRWTSSERLRIHEPRASADVEAASRPRSFGKALTTYKLLGCFRVSRRDVESRHAKHVQYAFSVALFSSPSPPLREERAGERRLHRCPPRPSPRSYLVGRAGHLSNTPNTYGFAARDRRDACPTLWCTGRPAFRRAGGMPFRETP